MRECILKFPPYFLLDFYFQMDAIAFISIRPAPMKYSDGPPGYVVSTYTAVGFFTQMKYKEMDHVALNHR